MNTSNLMTNAEILEVYDSCGTGELMERLNDENRFEEGSEGDLLLDILFSNYYEIIPERNCHWIDTEEYKETLEKLFSCLGISKEEYVKLLYGVETTDKICPHCGGILYTSDIPDYSYVCFACDENFYGIEVRDSITVKNNER